MTSDNDVQSAFFQAIERGDREQVERTLEAQPALASARNESGVSATLFSLYYREPAIAELLANSGAELTVFEAAALGRMERLRELLAADPAQANATSADGFSPLGLAAFFGQREAARALLDAGADPNRASQNSMRVAPLHSAVAAQQVDIAALLLEHGADVNAVQADDFSPLHEAAQNGQVEMIDLLLRHGADRAARKSDGQTAFDVAQAHGKTEAAARLTAQQG